MRKSCGSPRLRRLYRKMEKVKKNLAAKSKSADNVYGGFPPSMAKVKNWLKEFQHNRSFATLRCHVNGTTIVHDLVGGN